MMFEDAMENEIHKESSKEIEFNYYLIACRTNIVLFIGVGTNVDFQCTGLIVGLRTHGAFKRSLLGVNLETKIDNIKHLLF